MGTLAAHRTGVVRMQEAAHHEVARLDRRHGVPDRLDDAAVLVPDRGRPWYRRDPAVAPEVRAADAGGDGPHDGVRRLDDRGLGTLLVVDVPGCVNHGSEHVPHTTTPGATEEGTPRDPQPPTPSLETQVRTLAA